MKQAPRGHTAASIRAAQYVKMTNEDANKTKIAPFGKAEEEIFKMKKFRGVQAKVNTNRRSSAVPR